MEDVAHFGYRCLVRGLLALLEILEHLDQFFVSFLILHHVFLEFFLVAIDVDILRKLELLVFLQYLVQALQGIVFRIIVIRHS